MGSLRSPGKVLMEVAEKTMLERVVRRTQRCDRVDDVVVTTSTLPMGDAIVNACKKMDVPVSRGSDSDVLDRFTQAACFYSVNPEFTLVDILELFARQPTLPMINQNIVQKAVR
jgi:spore coat polysaccharide biosynthesis protein SpsF